VTLFPGAPPELDELPFFTTAMALAGELPRRDALDGGREPVG